MKNYFIYTKESIVIDQKLQTRFTLGFSYVVDIFSEEDIDYTRSTTDPTLAPGKLGGEIGIRPRRRLSGF